MTLLRFNSNKLEAPEKLGTLFNNPETGYILWKIKNGMEVKKESGLLYFSGNQGNLMLNPETGLIEFQIKTRQNNYPFLTIRDAKGNSFQYMYPESLPLLNELQNVLRWVDDPKKIRDTARPSLMTLRDDFKRALKGTIGTDEIELVRNDKLQAFDETLQGNDALWIKALEIPVEQSDPMRRNMALLAHFVYAEVNEEAPDLQQNFDTFLANPNKDNKNHLVKSLTDYVGGKVDSVDVKPQTVLAIGALHKAILDDKIEALVEKEKHLSKSNLQKIGDAILPYLRNIPWLGYATVTSLSNVAFVRENLSPHSQGILIPTAIGQEAIFDRFFANPISKEKRILRNKLLKNYINSETFPEAFSALFDIIKNPGAFMSPLQWAYITPSFTLLAIKSLTRLLAHTSPISNEILASLDDSFTMSLLASGIGFIASAAKHINYTGETTD